MVSRLNRFQDYRPVIGTPVWESILRLAQKLSGVKVKMVNSTAVGGGVAEILQRLVPLLKDLGVVTTWEVIEGDGEFFKATKLVHNALHGAREELTPRQQDIYWTCTEKNLRKFNFAEDYIFIHDPQPAGLIQAKSHSPAKWIWR